MGNLLERHAPASGAGRLLLGVYRDRAGQAGGRAQPADRRGRVPQPPDEGQGGRRHRFPGGDRRPGRARAARNDRHQEARRRPALVDRDRDQPAPGRADAQAAQDRRRLPGIRREPGFGE